MERNILTISDGLDPEFGHLDDIIVVGGDKVIFVMSKCKVLYFDSHYHSYVISITPNRLLLCDIADHNVHHGHKLEDGLTYVTVYMKRDHFTQNKFFELLARSCSP